MTIIDCQDSASHVFYKLTFLADALGQIPPKRGWDMSHESIEGLAFILTDITNEVQFIRVSLGQIRKRGEV